MFQKKRTAEKWKGSSFANRVWEDLGKSVKVNRKGEAKIKRGDVRKIIEGVFQEAAAHAAKGQRVRLPVIGALTRKNVPARAEGQGINPFTKAPYTIKARPASMKPRFSFSKTLKQSFSDSKNWN